MDFLSKKLMLGSSMAAMIAAAAATTASAQDNKEPESVTVSASRISIQGYEAPTPVTVIGMETLQRDAKVSIGDSIRELPSVGMSDSPNNGSHSGNAAQGDAGLDTINLRDLGAVRTLILFDGQRMVTSNPQAQEGGYDLSTLPQSLIERVDVVTGGASAAWGSDALAGVVNLVINKNFTGVKGSVILGDTSHDDHRSYKAELAYGTELFGGRGHMLLAGTYTMSPDAIFFSQRPWFNNMQSLFGGPAGGPARVRTRNYGSNQLTQGGLINASLAGTGTVGVGGVTALAPANALKGIQFLGDSAAPGPFNFGTTNSLNSSQCTNCSASFTSTTHQMPMIAVPYHTFTIFNYWSYKVTDSIKASLQLNFSQNYETNFAQARAGTFTIKSGNPFIPASVQQTMTAGGIPSFSLGSDTMNNRDPLNITLSGPNGFSSTMGQNFVLNQRQFIREVFTLDGATSLFGEDWTWNAYVEHSAVRVRERLPYNTINNSPPGTTAFNNINNALDAVVVTSGNVGTSGLPIGSIQCRTRLTTSNGCVPLNLFGTDNVSREALNYIAPGRTNEAVMDQATFLMNQTVFSVGASGVLPFGLDAGKVAVALGAESRLESQKNIGDPLGLGTSANGSLWESGNFPPTWANHYTVQEGFLEINAPILKNNIVQSLDVSAAGRITSYSTSGMVETWKLGATSQVNDFLRLRMTYSSDIRAPQVAELFAVANISNNGVQSDPVFSGKPAVVRSSQSGNPLLVPEQATTLSGGVIITPPWIEGLTLSADWYSISIHKAIFNSGLTSTLQLCGSGNKFYCQFVYKGVGLSPSGLALSEVDGNGVTAPASLGLFAADFDGALNFVQNVSFNAANESISGLDLQADYSHELFSGMLGWHLVGSYMDQRTRTANGVTVDAAGQLGPDSPGGFTTSPKLKALLSTTYTEGPYSFTLQGRFLGSARLVNTWREGIDVDNNGIPAVAYMDLRTSYQMTDRIQLFGAVDNVFNTSPPYVPKTTGLGNDNTNILVYDGLGRSFRFGLRFEY